MDKTDIISREEFQEVMDEVISDYKYQALLRGESFLEKVREKLDELADSIIKWLTRLFQKRAEVPETDTWSETMQNLFLAFAAIIAIVIITFIVLNVIKLFRGKGKIKEILGVEISKETTPNSLKNQAEEYEKKKDYTSAVRYHYIAFLLLLHNQHIIFLEETKTNEEIYTYLKKENYPNLQVLKEVIDVFNAIWYGKKDISDENYHAYKVKLYQLWEGVKDYEKEKQ